MMQTGIKYEEKPEILHELDKLAVSEQSIRFACEYFAKTLANYAKGSKEYRMIASNTSTIEKMLATAEKGKRKERRLERARKLLEELFKNENLKEQRDLLEAMKKPFYSAAENPAKMTERKCGTEITIDMAVSVLLKQGLAASQDEVFALIKEQNYQLRREEREGRIVEYVNGGDFLAMRECIKQSRQKVFP